MLTVIIATDNKPLREVLSSIILSQPQCKLAGVCADSHAAIAIASVENPHIVLIDGSSDPLAATAAIKKICNSTASGVIALTRQPDEVFAQHILAAGALGYLTHQSAADEILMAIQQVAQDNVYLCKALPALHTQAPVATPALDRPVATQQMAIHHTSFREKVAAIVIQWQHMLKFTG